MKDVGDALNMYLQESKDVPYLMVDFGIDKEEVDVKTFDNNVFRCYSHSADAFLLSHFHSDHYNGFVEFPSSSNFHDIYLPRFPEQMPNSILLKRIFFTKWLIQGNNLWVEILNLIVNKKNVPMKKIHLLSKGDVFLRNGHNYEVLWPPRKFDDGEKILTTRTKRVIDLFNEIIKEDNLFSDIYNSLGKCDLDIIETNDRIAFDKQSKEILKELIRSYRFQQPSKKTNKYKKFNEALQDAANRLSIAFRQEDNVLFLGDLEAHELQCVAKELKKREQLHYDCVIAAHHGTHWNRSMRDLNCDNCLASVGKNLVSKVDTHYKTITSKLFLTHQINDIVLQKNQYLIL